MNNEVRAHSVETTLPEKMGIGAFPIPVPVYVYTICAQIVFGQCIAVSLTSNT
jgi:hypothetical protein